MRQYKIVQMKNGHGDSKFRVKARQGWWWFSFWCDWSNLQNTMKEATDKVEEFINDEKSNQRIKVKEYVYTTVPNHVPDEQVGKFMELKNK